MSTTLTSLKTLLRDTARKTWHVFYPYTGLRGLDKKLLPFLPDGVGYFIEAGANDGIRQSNTYFLEKRRSWTGLLVEPVPRLAMKCSKNRPKSVVSQVVLVPPEKSGTSIKIIDLDLMTLVADQEKGLIDTSKHVQLAEAVQGITATEITVRGITLSELLDQQGSPKIDLFSLDVEGFEVDVLQGLDLSRHRPELILVETRGFNDLSHVLKDHYNLIATLSHHDYLFKAKISL
jgi:FkbM family methyltransferase